MSSKREEERIEKIIRGLLKLPPNRRCINCNGLGPQYVCTNFWTFVCLTCSGIHREFTHRVKSISMSKFTREEVEALQNGGNQRARDIFLKEWDMQQMRLPDNSKADKIREFIKDVYVNKKYCGGKSSDNPPTDGESPMNQDGPRRADSYHSFSQSPPYDYQYEDRRYGKQFGALTRHTSSDLSRFQGKAASVTYSPGRQHGQLYEDRFANESTVPRMSDFSVSSAGDQFNVQSPNYQDAGYGSPHARQLKNSPVINVSSQMPNRNTVATFKKNNNEITVPRRSASSGSVASEGSSMSRKAVDTVGRSLHSRASQMASSSSVLSSSQSPTPHTPGPGQGVFKLQTTQKPKVSSPPPDLLSGFDDEPSFSQPSSTNLFEDKAPSVSVSQNEGWAMFDAPVQPVPVATENVTTSMSVLTGAMTLDANIAGLAAPNESGIDAATKPGVSAAVLPGNIPTKGSQDGLTQNNSWWPAAQNLGPNGFSSQTQRQWPLNLHEDNKLVQQNALQLWNAFDDSSVNSSHAPVVSQPQNALEQHNLSAEAFQDPVPNAAVVGPEVSFNAAIVRPSFSAPNEHFMGGYMQAQKSTNPFDLPDDSGSATTSSVFDMNYLQAALPNSQPNNEFIAGFSQPWFPQNSIPTFHSLPEGLGSFQHIAGQGPNTQLPNLPPQGHVASLGGNPFA